MFTRGGFWPVILSLLFFFGMFATTKPPAHPPRRLWGHLGKVPGGRAAISVVFLLLLSYQPFSAVIPKMTIINKYNPHLWLSSTTMHYYHHLLHTTSPTGNPFVVPRAMAIAQHRPHLAPSASRWSFHRKAGPATAGSGSWEVQLQSIFPLNIISHKWWI